MTFSERLTDLRKKSGMSQEQLAEKLGLTRQTVSKWENGQSTPELAYIAILSELLGVTTDYLIKGTQNVSAEEILQPKNARFAIDKKVLSALMISGTVTVLTLIVIAVLAICSTLHPHTVYWNSVKYSGLIGYAMVTHSVPLLITVSALFVISAICFAISLKKYLKSFEKH